MPTPTITAAQYRQAHGLEPAGTRAPRKRRLSQGEKLLAEQILAAGLPVPERNAQFTPPGWPRWQVDFLWRDGLWGRLGVLPIGVEVDGGPHGIKSHLERDRLKDAAARVLGLELWRFTPAMIRDGLAIGVLSAIAFGRRERVGELIRRYAKGERDGH